ncbi:MAG TPA: ABC transporter permease [Candidatus Limnocylindria bacterium]|nr:ABC transporter permease [Candidatus Limnocylindria bacterium]
MATAEIASPVPSPVPIRRASAGLWSDAIWRIRHDPTTMVALAVILILAVVSILADFLADNVFHHSFSQQSLLDSYTPPSFDEPYLWLGTDDIGRSQIVRLIYGGRVSLSVGLFGALTSMVIGVTLGISSGYFRGWWDDLVQWLVQTVNNIPQLFLFLIIGAYFRLNPITFVLLLGGLGWLGICNQARGLTFGLREREFTTAARTIGASPVRIMFKHIFPNILPLMIIIAMIDIGAIILLESALSFIGFGIQPPTASWGNMLTKATQFVSHGPWLIYPPGLLIFVTVLCLYLIGDGLRDALDPRLRGQK